MERGPRCKPNDGPLTASPTDSARERDRGDGERPSGVIAGIATPSSAGLLTNVRQSQQQASRSARETTSDAPTKSPRSYPAAAAMLPAKVLADYDSISAEALAMPVIRRRGAPRNEARGSLVPVHQEHTVELQEVLARSGHLLRRPSLRKLVAQILGDPTILVQDEGKTNGEDGEDECEDPSTWI